MSDGNSDPAAAKIAHEPLDIQNLNEKMDVDFQPEKSGQKRWLDNVRFIITIKIIQKIHLRWKK